MRSYQRRNRTTRFLPPHCRLTNKTRQQSSQAFFLCFFQIVSAFSDALYFHMITAAPMMIT